MFGYDNLDLAAMAIAKTKTPCCAVCRWMAATDFRDSRKEAVWVWVWASPGLALHCTVSGHALQEAEAIFEDHIYIIIDINTYLRCRVLLKPTLMHFVNLLS